MNNKFIIKNKLRNERAKVLLKIALLEYSNEILRELSAHPEQLPGILDELQISEKRFFSYLNDDPKANISFYDQALILIKKNNLNNK